MRYSIAIFAMSLTLVSLCLGQVADEDVIYLKNGGTVRGTIIEMVPNKSVTLRATDGDVHIFAVDEIERITKEPIPTTSIESWYLYFALGYGKPFYASGLQETVDQIGSSSKAISLSMDLLGVYWPLGNDRTLLGGTINVVADRFQVSHTTVMIQQHLYSLSVMHFLRSKIGDGVFIRGDVGFAVLDFDFGGTEELSWRKSGYGCLLGCGYSFAVSNETRITANLNYGLRIIEGDAHGALSINVGILL